MYLFPPVDDGALANQDNRRPSGSRVSARDGLRSYPATIHELQNASCELQKDVLPPTYASLLQ
jgi:hypothetical protein